MVRDTGDSPLPAVGDLVFGGVLSIECSIESQSLFVSRRVVRRCSLVRSIANGLVGCMVGIDCFIEC